MSSFLQILPVLSRFHTHWQLVLRARTLTTPAPLMSVLMAERSSNSHQHSQIQLNLALRARTLITPAPLMNILMAKSSSNSHQHSQIQLKLRFSAEVINDHCTEVVWQAVVR
jgi:hypothetical protein